MNDTNQSKKRKTVIRTAFVALVISIVLCVVAYFGIQRYMYVTGYENNAVLYAYDVGEIDIIDENTFDVEATEKNKVDYVILQKDDRIHVINHQKGYLKMYRNGILMWMLVENPLAEEVSYLNPRFWFTGTRVVHAARQIEVRSEKEYQRVLNGHSSYPLFQKKDELIEVRDEIFIN